MVVKALLEKKAKEMEGTIAEINQANKETQMKLNSCEFNLQIKEHEVSILIPVSLPFQKHLG